MTFLIFLLGFTSLYGETLWEHQEGPFQAYLEGPTRPIKPDEIFNLTLFIRYPSRYQVRISEDWPFSPLSAFALQVQERSTTKEQDHELLSIRYQLTPILTGQTQIQLAAILFLNGQLVLSTFYPPLINFTIDPIPSVPLLQEEPLLRLDNLDPMEMNRKNRLSFEKKIPYVDYISLLHKRSFPIKNLVIALFLIFLLPVTIILLKNKRSERKQLSSRTKLLNYLKTIHPSAQEDPVSAYQDINLLFRFYIQDTLNLRASHLTTEELLVTLSQREEMSENKKGLLKKLLMESDRIKFKGKIPTYKDLELSLKLINEIVH
ncbi:MAG: hypothetical protein ACSNEK_03575 [Parachlamydiaceae bacterium]